MYLSVLSENRNQIEINTNAIAYKTYHLKTSKEWLSSGAAKYFMLSQFAGSKAGEYFPVLAKLCMKNIA